MTYVQKFAKRYGDEDLVTYYEFLCNAAHPNRFAKLAYQISWSTHETGAYGVRRRSRRPRAEGQIARDEFPIVTLTALATAVFGNEGWRLLKQALFIVDDFGLTTGSGLLTLHAYWRKLKPGRKSSETCPCGCGKWGAAKHRWGQPAPKIRVPRD